MTDGDGGNPVVVRKIRLSMYGFWDDPDGAGTGNRTEEVTADNTSRVETRKMEYNNFPFEADEHVSAEGNSTRPTTRRPVRVRL